MDARREASASPPRPGHAWQVPGSRGGTSKHQTLGQYWPLKSDRWRGESCQIGTRSSVRGELRCCRVLLLSTQCGTFTPLGLLDDCPIIEMCISPVSHISHALTFTGVVECSVLRRNTAFHMSSSSAKRVPESRHCSDDGAPRYRARAGTCAHRSPWRCQDRMLGEAEGWRANQPY